MKPKAAVLVLYRHGISGDQVLLVRKAKHLRSHAGEVALPGGKIEPGDEDITATALREAREEVNLNVPVTVERILPASATGSGMLVAPVVARLNEAAQLQADQDELVSLKWIDLNWFKQDPRQYTDVFLFRGREWWCPVYRYEDYTIWGFTARVLLQFFNEHLGWNIMREHAAPERFRNLDLKR